MHRLLKNALLLGLKMHRGWVERRAFDDFHAAPWRAGIKYALAARENANRRGSDWENYHAAVKMWADAAFVVGAWLNGVPLPFDIADPTSVVQRH